MKKLPILTAILCLLFPYVIYANCPPMDEVIYQCVQVGLCNWSAPWWDGYRGKGNPNEGDHPRSFALAFWGEGQTPNVGSTNCFYLDDGGELVELSQNSWGGVPKPTAPVWKEGSWPTDNSYPGMVCSESIESCTFPYPKLGANH
jgi:hypothetical protein